MRLRATLIAGVTLGSFALGASTSPAQVWTTLDVGGAAVRYDDSVNVTATTLTPRLRFDHGRVAGSVIGTLSSFLEGGWTGHGALDVSVLSGAVGPLRLELGGEAGGSVHDDATRTGQYLGRARLHLGNGTRGVWAGTAGGRTWDASLWHPVVQGDFGAWARIGRVQLFAMVTPSAVGDSLRYTDAQGAVRWDGRRVELALGMGARSGDRFARESPTWGSVAATLWFTSRVGLVAAGGRYPVDYTQGYPGGRYVSLAVRLGGRPHATLALSSHVQAARTLSSRTAGPRLETAPLPNGRQVIRVHAPGAQIVELMGDFTAWQPIALTPAANGWWTTMLAIEPRVYQLNVRVNGDAWDVPAGVLETVDEFGARVGVVDLR